jgi:FkbM family methyltransferase
MKRVTSLTVGDVRLHLVHRLLRFRLRTLVRGDVDLIRLGSELCGWWIPAAAVRPDAVAYCGGAGKDITFDLELLARGCRVTTFDPTPRAIAYVRGLGIDAPEFRFVPVGWWDEETELRFYTPRTADSPNFSVVNLQKTADYVTGRVKRIVDLMAELGDTTVDILKLDVEGAEYRVLHNILEVGPAPAVLCVEFDQPVPPSRTVNAVRQLVTAGYELVHIEFFNYTFVRRGELGSPGEGAG